MSNNLKFTIKLKCMLIVCTIKYMLIAKFTMKLKCMLIALCNVHTCLAVLLEKKLNFLYLYYNFLLYL